eukprot:14350347-Ditylum_brightwellii.AAC.1
MAKVENCIDITANGGTPYSQEQILTIAYTGLYNEKCIAWEDLPQARKAWLQWKIFFTKVVRDCRRLQQVAGKKYQANSAVTETLQQD